MQHENPTVARFAVTAGAPPRLTACLPLAERIQRRGVPIIGFPGILIRACQQGIIDPEDVLSALEKCRRQGTHYSPKLIKKVYTKLKRSE